MAEHDLWAKFRFFSIPGMRRGRSLAPSSHWKAPHTLNTFQNIAWEMAMDAKQLINIETFELSSLCRHFATFSMKSTRWGSLVRNHYIPLYVCSLPVPNNSDAQPVSDARYTVICVMFWLVLTLVGYCGLLFWSGKMYELAYYFPWDPLVMATFLWETWKLRPLLLPPLENCPPKAFTHKDHIPVHS